MRSSKTVTKCVDADGKPGEVVITSYHCETCGSFVRSEQAGDADVPAAGANRT